MAEQGLVERKAMKILVVDDHPIIKEGLITFLGQYPDVNIIGVAGDGCLTSDLVGQKPAKSYLGQPLIICVDLISYKF